MGGDEFAVCLNGPIDHDQLVERCTRIVEEGVAYVDQADVEHSITLSIGGVELKDKPISYRNAYQQADSALYRAKAEGKNCAVAYLEGMAYPEGGCPTKPASPASPPPLLGD